MCDLQDYLWDKIVLDYFHDLCYIPTKTVCERWNCCKTSNTKKFKYPTALKVSIKSSKITHKGVLFSWRWTVIIMKKFAQLMQHFHWSRSPWRQNNIFWYSLLWRKMVASLVIIGEREKQKPLQQIHFRETNATKWLEQSDCNEVIARWRRFILSSTLSYSYTGRIQRI